MNKTEKNSIRHLRLLDRYGRKKLKHTENCSITKSNSHCDCEDYDKIVVNHFADCTIYRSPDVYKFIYCNCGLLHDLFLFDDKLIEEIYPNWFKEVELGY